MCVEAASLPRPWSAAAPGARVRRRRPARAPRPRAGAAPRRPAAAAARTCAAGRRASAHHNTDSRLQTHRNNHRGSDTTLSQGTHRRLVQSDSTSGVPSVDFEAFYRFNDRQNIIIAS